MTSLSEWRRAIKVETTILAHAAKGGGSLDEASAIERFAAIRIVRVYLDIKTAR